MSRGIIYVMWNELFPELVKIGVTSGSTTKDVEKRRQRLSSIENMPQPFEAKFAICINNYKEVESIIHKGLAKLRHNPHREFFKLSVEEAIHLLSSYVVSGAAVEVPVKNDFLPDEQKAIENMQKQRKTITFRSLNIPIGTTLTFVKDKNYKVKTFNDSRIVIMPDGNTNTLSIAAKTFHKKMNPKTEIKGLPDGAKDFVYRGKTLWELSLEKQRTKVES